MAAIVNLLLWPVGVAIASVLALATPARPAVPAGCVGTPDLYSCVLAEAVRREDPTLCEALGAAVDDRCMFDLLRAVDDRTACKKVQRWAIREACYKAADQRYGRITQLSELN